VKYDGKIVFDIPSRVTTDNDDNDKFVVVNSSNENRLDLISQANYGTPKYWWVIADVNKISNPFVVPVGTVLRLPPMSNIIMTGVVS
jgi:nucleoid-associated protein YgaU